MAETDFSPLEHRFYLLIVRRLQMKTPEYLTGKKSNIFQFVNHCNAIIIKSFDISKI